MTTHILSALLQAIAARQPPPGVTLNPSDKGSGITLSGGNLVANGAATNNVRATASLATGKAYFEVTINSGAGGNALGVGIANASMPLTTGLGLDSSNNSLSWYDTDAVYFNDSSIGSAEIMSNGNTIGLAIDFGAQKFWGCNISTAPTNWNGSSGNVPGSSGGLSFGASSGPWFPALGFRNTGQMTVNFGASSFAGSVPSGFTAYNSLA